MATPLTKPNILILMTDQQRQVQHFPDHFTEKYLPNLHSLMKNGVTFTNAVTNACRCSPVRGMLWTGLYPPRTGLTAITPNMKLDPSLPTLGYLLSYGSSVTLPPTPNQQNPPTDQSDIYYNVAYNGKWHCYGAFTEGAGDGNWPSAKSAYTEYKDMFDIWGLPGWQSPDAGTSLTNNNTVGGGPFTAESTGNSPQYEYQGEYAIQPDYGQPDGPRRWNDERYADNAIAFLDQYNSDTPFIAVASLVNPHDIWAWDKESLPDFFPEAYYYIFGQGDKPTLSPVPDGYFIVNGEQKTAEQFMTDFVNDFKNSCTVQSWLKSGNFNDDLSQKPAVHAQVQAAYNPDPSSETEALQYLTFYGYLNYLSDVLHGKICKKLEDTKGPDGNPLSDNTVIVRIADHGETGCSHAGMMEKDINVYQETISVPIVFSNKKYWKDLNIKSPAMMGTIDLAPTLLEMAGLDLSSSTYQNGNGKSIFQGVSFNSLLNELIEHPPGSGNGVLTPVLPQASLITYNDGYGGERYDWMMRGVLAAPGTHTVSGGTVDLDKWYKYAVYYTYEDPQEQGGPGTEPVLSFEYGNGQIIYVQFELYKDYHHSDETNNLLASEPSEWSTVHSDLHELLTYLMTEVDELGPTPQPTDGRLHQLDGVLFKVRRIRESATVFDMMVLRLPVH